MESHLTESACCVAKKILCILWLRPGDWAMKTWQTSLIQNVVRSIICAREVVSYFVVSCCLFSSLFYLFFLSLHLISLSIFLSLFFCSIHSMTHSHTRSTNVSAITLGFRATRLFATKPSVVSVIFGLCEIPVTPHAHFTRMRGRVLHQLAFNEIKTR